MAIFGQNIFRQRRQWTIWDIWSDIDGGVVASMAATFTSNICAAQVRLLEKPNICIGPLLNNETQDLIQLFGDTVFSEQNAKI